MTIYDLKWEPSRIGMGFTATHKFDNGRTATILHAGRTYDLYIRAKDGRIIYCKQGLDRMGLMARMNYHGQLS